MMLRGIFALGLILAGTGGASAAGGSSPLHRVSCVMVRFYVARYSMPAAESWARSHGASEAEIETARGCLKGQSPAQLQAAAAQLSPQ